MQDTQAWQEPPRARRIRDRDRMRARGYRIAKNSFGYCYPHDHLEPSPFSWRDRHGDVHRGLCDMGDVIERRWIFGVTMGDTLKACSCMGCGNPRRWFGTLSMSEWRNSHSAADELEENGLVCTLAVSTRRGRD